MKLIDPTLLPQVETAIKSELEDILALNTAASKHPYYKYVSPFSSE